MTRSSDEFDFFVSYARKDNESGWITRFVEELLNEHGKFSGGRKLNYFFDKQDIRSFDDWQHRIHDALSKSRLFLAFISPNYFGSEWCRREWKGWIDTEIAKHILSSGAAPIYLIEIPGFVGKVSGLREQATLDENVVARNVAELCGLATPHDSFIASASTVVRQMRDRRQITSHFVKPFADEGVNALRREDLRQVLVELAHDLDERADRVRKAAESANTVPPYNKKFSGRLEELLSLRERLKDDQAGVICGVHGLGGIGKTELAFTYAHAFASAYPGGRFLIPCEHKASLRDAILTLGDYHEFRERISDEERKKPENYFAAVVRCLASRLKEKGHVLLVLDNVADTSLVSPQQTDSLTALGPQLHLLATTRLLPASGGNWLTLGELPEADALDLLEKHRPFITDAERDAAIRIVERLGGYSLAVELVAAWLSVHPAATYVHLEDGLGLADLETIAMDQDVELRRHNHEHRLSAVLGPVLKGLIRAERRVLEYAALLPSDYVPLPWLKELACKEFPELGKPTRLINDPWQEVWQRLMRMALFNRAGDEITTPHIVRVHRLVQDKVRGEMATHELTTIIEAIDSLVVTRCSELGQTTKWQDDRWELEPLDALANLWDEKKHADTTWLLNTIGLHWHTIAEWNRAEILMRRSLNIDERTYGPNDLKVALCLNNLALLFRSTSRLAEAEFMTRRALAIVEESNCSDNQELAVCLNNMACSLEALNRLAEAEPLRRRVLALVEQSNCREYPLYLNNLASLLQKACRLEEAEPLMRRALAIGEQILGSDRPDIAVFLNNLASLLQDTNRLAESETLMRRALAIVERSYGPDHPRVADCLTYLASLLQDTNRIAEAEPLIRRALAIDKQSYGPEYPAVARDLSNLAVLLMDTDRFTEAEPLIHDALNIDEKSFGPDHSKVAVRLSHLARLLQATNRKAEAEPLRRRALAIDELSFGPDHPNVAKRLGKLAKLLQLMNRFIEAEPLMVRALAIDEQSFGSDHPKVVKRMSNLVDLRKAMNYDLFIDSDQR